MQNTMFQSSFWPWFIGISVILSFVGMIWLFRWMSGGKKSKGEKVETMGHVWDENLAEYNNPLPLWWLNMFYLTLVFAAVYLILYPGLGFFGGALGWTQAQQYETEIQEADAKYNKIFDAYKEKSISELAKDGTAMKTGERLFINYCSTCHGVDAGGAPGFPNLRDAAWLYGDSPEKIYESIAKGRTAMGMIAWKDALGGDAGVKDTTQYVLSLGGREHDAAAAARGQAKFALCAGCHGLDGKGNQMLGAPDLTDQVWLYGGKIQDIEESIAKGRQGVMPPHEDFLGAAKVHVLAAYVYSLSGRD